MKKTDLVVAVSEKTGMSKKDSTAAVDAVFAAITDALVVGDKVSLVGFGTFVVKERAAREGVNPAKKGEKIMIPATKVPSFKAAKALKDEIKG